MTQAPAPAPSALPTGEIVSAIERACDRMAPSWPLDRLAASNPLWGMVDLPVEEASAKVASLAGSRLVMPRSWYRERWRKGLLEARHLQAALDRSQSQVPLKSLVAAIDTDPAPVKRRSLVTHLVDEHRDLARQMAWAEFVVDDISQACAGWFDDGQSQLHPDRAGSLYGTWLAHAHGNHGPSLLMGLRTFTSLAQDLPGEPRALINLALRELGVATDQYESYLTALLLDVGGWASACAYRRFIASQNGSTDDSLEDLLAMRAAWDLILFRASDALAYRWELAMAAWPQCDRLAADTLAEDWLLQYATEIAYQESIRDAVAGADPSTSTASPEVQIAFCIDVRSEVLRRAIEAEGSKIQTLGFAGFFGLPAEYLPLAASAARPHLPGPLAPKLQVVDEGVAPRVEQARRGRLGSARTWKSFMGSASSGFSFVETTGFLYGAKLLTNAARWTRTGTHPDRAGLTSSEHATRRPRLSAGEDGSPLSVEQRAELAEGILRGMSLTHGFARLVALVGHGSQTVNNPQAAGLDCGACCGHTGEVSSRAVAAVLNDEGVREVLSTRGIQVPETTHFVPGLHDTTTDDVKFFDLDEVPATHTRDVSTLQAQFERAGTRARAERAGRLGIDASKGDADVRRQVHQRARDWSEVRPEWGLTRNAAFIVAPRERTRSINLDGRSFLHDYRWEDDPEFSVLELIMTAPMVVTHWINFQYYASTVDNVRFGSGNKVLHNVVGGHLGVYEGNGGDLRIGLPMQSLHDGEQWVHEPLRLSVFIEAPREEIDRVIAKHPAVAQLVEGQWLHLFQIDSETGETWNRHRGEWVSPQA